MVSWKYGELMLYGNTVNDYLVAAALFVLTWFVLHSLVYFLSSYVQRRSTDHSLYQLLHDMLDTVGTPLYVTIAIYVGMQSLTLSSWLVHLVNVAVLIIGVVYVMQGVALLIDRFTQRLIDARDTESSLIRVLGRIGKGVAWLIAALFVLSNLGVEITTFVASLGIGGVAIAFALQNILGDIFASFSIYFDKPFEVGDFIIIGDDMGTVRHIGIKSTRLETLRGEELVVSNTELTSTRVHNFKKMEKRRVEFNFGILYETDVQLVKQVPEMVEEVIEGVEQTELDRVHFKSFGDSALNFEVVYYVDAAEYNEYMDVQEQINLGIMERFEDEGIEFAYPTRTVYMQE